MFTVDCHCHHDTVDIVYTVCVGDYVFTVDCRCHDENVDIVFTDNETDSVRRRRVLHKRQLKTDESRRRKDVAGKDDVVPVSGSEPVEVRSTGCSSAATATAGCTLVGSNATAIIAHTTAELSWSLTVSPPLDADAASSDADSSTDEDSEVVSVSHSSAAPACYTKDAFHRYVIAG